MKAIAINASPKMDKGLTAMILTPFLDGIREAGGEVEVFYTKKLKINPCDGELSCWFKTPGVCFQKDDMEMLLPRLAEADIWVFATPVYVGSMTGPLKNLLDRSVPLVPPFFELHNGHCSHPLREGAKPGKLVLVSSCAFWEIDNFDPLIAHIKDFCRNMNMKYAGALLRPHSRAFKSMADWSEPVSDIIEAAREAGKQLVREGIISSDNFATISRTLLPLEIFLDLVNQRFQQLLAEKGSK